MSSSNNNDNISSDLTGGEPSPLKRDRDWLKKLLQKHADDPRLAPYHTPRVEKYPLLQDKALVLAPMVDQSDLPFRLLCRKYGTNLCFTPMIHAKMLAHNPGYRKKFWNWGEENGGGMMPCQDRPLIVQLCGSDKLVLEQAIRIILKAPCPDGSEFPIDGIDINCGCPQDIARRGKYGAYLLEQQDLLVDLVRHLAQTFYPLPISVKVRLLPSGVPDSLQLYERLVDAGAAMLTIHGRNRFQKGNLTGPANWDAIRKAVELVGQRIPILANGSMWNLDCVNTCLEQTGADGVMSSEAILEYPAMFTLSNTQSTQGKRTGPGRLSLTKEYLELCKEYPPDQSGQGTGLSTIRAHLFKLLFQDTQDSIELRDHLANSKTFDGHCMTCTKLEEIYQKRGGHSVEEEQLSWYFRYWHKNGTKVPHQEKRHRIDQEAEEDKDRMEDMHPTKEIKWTETEHGGTELQDSCCHDEC